MTQRPDNSTGTFFLIVMVLALAAIAYLSFAANAPIPFFQGNP